MMSNQTHWKKLTNPNYLGAYAFDKNETKTVTIKSYGQENVKDEKGRSEELPVMHFAENVKPLIVNKTNNKNISKSLGTPYIEEWIGRKIAIYATTTKFGKETVDCVRVKDFPVSEKITCGECKQQVKPAHGMTEQRVAEYTKKKYGIELCAECGAKRKEAANGAKAEPGPDQGELPWD